MKRAPLTHRSGFRRLYSLGSVPSLFKPEMVLLSPWHTLLAVMRLPKPSETWRVFLTVQHSALLFPLALLYLAMASPNSAALTTVSRITMYGTIGRADVDIGPTAWHVLFFLFLAYSLVMLGGVIWVHATGKSLVR